MKAIILLIVVLCAGQPALAADFSVTNVGFSAYAFSGAASGSNPTLTLVRGTTYTFGIDAPGHPFWIKTVQGTGTQNAFPGVTGNGTAVGTITWSVPQSAPDTLFYNCQVHSPMTGTIHVTGSGATATPTPPKATPTPTATETRTSTPTATPTDTPTETSAPQVTPTPTPPTVPPMCTGDCNGDGQVTVNETIAMVNVALDQLPVTACTAGDANQDGLITVNEIISSVDRALSGCPSSGRCYEQVDCLPLPFATAMDRAACCQVALRCGSCPFTWCADTAIDPSTGACTHCVLPCGPEASQ